MINTFIPLKLTFPNFVWGKQYSITVGNTQSLLQKHHSGCNSPFNSGCSVVEVFGLKKAVTE